MIVSSEIISKSVQIDGRISVREEHIDDAGVSSCVDYMAEAKADLDAHLKATAERYTLDAVLHEADAEINAQAEVAEIQTQIAVLTEKLPLAEAKVAEIQAAKLVSLEPIEKVR
jgi:hypothetical protein